MVNRDSLKARFLELNCNISFNKLHKLKYTYIKINKKEKYMFWADTGTRKRLKGMQILFILCLLFITSRLFYIQMFKSDWLQEKAYEQQTRDRLIKANRGAILDRNNVAIATTETVASISVINSQIKDFEAVAKELAERLNLSYDYVFEKINKKVALERIKTKVDKELADEIRDLNLKGVMIEKRVTSLIQWLVS